MAESEGRTVLRTFCSECALSPRAPRASVELVGGGGFPVHLSGCCPQCSEELVAVQTGPVTARPLALVYDPDAELRSYRVYSVSEPSIVV